MRRFIFIFFFFCSLAIQAQTVKVIQPIKFLALGDSYTYGTSVSKEESWPEQFLSRLKNDGFAFDTMAIIGRTGWTTSVLEYAIQTENPYGKFNLVSLLIGVNNQYSGRSLEDYEADFRNLLNTAVTLAGSKERVFVLSIPDYGYTPFGSGNQAYISSQIDAFNEVNKTITDSYNIAYFDITGFTRLGLANPEYVAADGLHPSGIMYGLWVDFIAPNFENDLLNSSNHNLLEYDNTGNIRIIVSENGIRFLSPENSNLEGSSFSIYSISGRKIYTGKYFPGIIPENVGQGIYIYELSSKSGKTFRGKFVWER